MFEPFAFILGMLLFSWAKFALIIWLCITIFGSFIDMSDEAKVKRKEFKRKLLTSVFACWFYIGILVVIYNATK